MSPFEFFFSFYGLLLGFSVAELVGGFARLLHQPLRLVDLDASTKPSRKAREGGLHVSNSEGRTVELLVQGLKLTVPKLLLPRRRPPS